MASIFSPHILWPELSSIPILTPGEAGFTGKQAQSCLSTETLTVPLPLLGLLHTTLPSHSPSFHEQNCYSGAGEMVQSVKCPLEASIRI